jgi:tRNA(Ile)-lysidine synthase
MDTPGRVLAAAVQWIGNAPYRPRLEALRDFAGALRRGETRTLGGVRASVDRPGIARLTREVAATEGPVAVQTDARAATLWDGRWLVSRSDGQAAHPGSPLVVAALGDAGLLACPGWRDAGLPRASLLASPAIWQASQLIAAPLAGLSGDWQARLCLPFDRFIVSH